MAGNSERMSTSASPTPARAVGGSRARPTSRRWRLFLVLGLLAIAAAGALHLIPRARERYVSGQSLEQLAGWAERSPNDALVLYYYGDALLKKGSAAEAVRVFQRAVDADPSVSRHYTGLARSMAAAGRPKAAAVLLKKTQQLAPRDVEPYFYLAKIYVDNSQPLMAVPELETAVRLQPRNARIWYALGHTCALAFKRDRSLEALERAVQLDARQPDYWRDLGRAHWDYSRLDDAERAFKQALSLRRDDPNLLIWLGQVYLQKPDSEANRRLAEETFRTCVGVAPNMGEAHLKLGEVLLRMERYSEAERELRRTLVLAPEQDQALFQLGQVLVRQGRGAEAKKYLDAFEEMRHTQNDVEALKDQIAHTPRKAELRLRLARLYRRYGNTSDAVPEYREYMALKPTDAAVRRELADCLRQPAPTGPAALAPHGPLP